MSLFDSHLAWLGNVGSNYLLTGKTPARYGNEHPNIVPYQSFATADGWAIVAVGSDRLWQRFCHAIQLPDLLEDERFTTNADRIRNRAVLIPILEEVMRAHTTVEWVAILEEAGVPAGPVNTVDVALESPQAQARGLVQEVPHPVLGPLRMVGSPLKLERTPPVINRHPPMLGEHTEQVLAELREAEQ
jgi:crotonobetainyl-CoA:carnitine CoA-transferase CaiB-like acyl-CoA transferase